MEDKFKIKTIKEYRGEWIREVRETHGLTLRSVAHEIGISAAYLSDMELGRRKVSEKVGKYFENL